MCQLFSGGQGREPEMGLLLAMTSTSGDIPNSKSSTIICQLGLPIEV